MSNPLYRTCDVQRVPYAPCLNEGLYFCTICSRHYCEDHTCKHLACDMAKASDASEDVIPEVRSTDGGFRETTEQILRDMPEMYLRSYHSRLHEELKRVQREIERRTPYNKSYIPERRQFVPVEKPARKVNTAAKEDAKLQKLSDALDKLIASNPSMTKEKLEQLLRKVK